MAELTITKNAPFFHSLLKFSFTSSWDCINQFLLCSTIPPSFSHHLFFIRDAWAAGGIPAGSGCGALMLPGQVTSITDHSHSHTLQLLKNISFPLLLPPFVWGSVSLSSYLHVHHAAASLTRLKSSSTVELLPSWLLSVSSSLKLPSFRSEWESAFVTSSLPCWSAHFSSASSSKITNLFFHFYLSAESNSLSGASPVLGASTVMV